MNDSAIDLSEFDKYDEPRLHMEHLMKMRLFDLEIIPFRVLCILERAGIRTLGDLANRTRAEVAALPQLGALSLEKIDKFLERGGLWYRE